MNNVWRSSRTVDTLVGSPSSRSRDIGNKLIKASIDKCRDLGCFEAKVSKKRITLKPDGSINSVVLQSTASSSSFAGHICPKCLVSGNQ